MMSWSFVGQIAVLTILALLVLLVLVGFVVAFRQATHNRPDGENDA